MGTLLANRVQESRGDRRVHRLRDKNGVILRSEDHIPYSFADFYETRYTHTLQGSRKDD